MRRLLARRDARVYLLGQVFSLFGDSSLWLAMGIWVKTLTHSNAQAGLVFFFFTAPSLLAPASGVLVDSYRRRPVLIATNALTGLAVLALLAVHGAGQVWLIDAVMVAYGLSYTVLGPAQSALLTVMLPIELLADANGALNTIQQALRLVGPLAGAGLFIAVGGHLIAIIDSTTFAIAVMSLLLLRVREPRPQLRRERWSRKVMGGAHHIWRTIELRQAVIAGACTTTVFGFIETIAYAIAGQGLHKPAAFIGVLAAIQGAGAVAGGLSAAALVRRLREGRLMGLALLIAAVGALLQIPPVLPTVLLGELVFGAAIPWLIVSLITLSQRLTPSELQGRVYAAAETLITTPQTVSIALGAGLITLTGYRPLLAAMAAIFILAAAYLLTRPQPHASPLDIARRRHRMSPHEHAS